MTRFIAAILAIGCTSQAVIAESELEFGAVMACSFRKLMFTELAGAPAPGKRLGILRNAWKNGDRDLGKRLPPVDVVAEINQRIEILQERGIDVPPDLKLSASPQGSF